MWAAESTSPRPVSISMSGAPWSSAIKVVVFGRDMVSFGCDEV